MLARCRTHIVKRTKMLLRKSKSLPARVDTSLRMLNTPEALVHFITLFIVTPYHLSLSNLDPQMITPFEVTTIWLSRNLMLTQTNTCTLSFTALLLYKKIIRIAVHRSLLLLYIHPSFICFHTFQQSPALTPNATSRPLCVRAEAASI